MPPHLVELITLHQLCQAYGLRPHDAETLTNWERAVFTVGTAYDAEVARNHHR